VSGAPGTVVDRGADKLDRMRRYRPYAEEREAHLLLGYIPDEMANLAGG